jgi:AAA domain
MPNSPASYNPYHHPELQRKLDTIGSIFIRHDDILDGWEVLERTYHLGFRVNEASTGYIYGHSRCGKTELAHRFIKHLTGKRPIRGPVCQFVEGNGLRIIYLDLTNGSAPLPASMLLLRLFRDIKANTRLSQPDATARVIDNLLQHRPDMLFVDEAQQAFRGDGTYSVNSLGDWLLPLENARACKVALIGSPKLRRLFETVEAARERHGGIAYLPPFPSRLKWTYRFSAAFWESFSRECLLRGPALLTTTAPSIGAAHSTYITQAGARLAGYRNYLKLPLARRSYAQRAPCPRRWSCQTSLAVSISSTATTSA